MVKRITDLEASNTSLKSALDSVSQLKLPDDNNIILSRWGHVVMMLATNVTITEDNEAGYWAGWKVIGAIPDGWKIRDEYSANRFVTGMTSTGQAFLLTARDNVIQVNTNGTQLPTTVSFSAVWIIR